MANPNPDRQRKARAELRSVLERGENAFAIHYACQSLEAATTPRVTSIAIRNLADGTSLTFSIHMEIELAAAEGRQPTLNDVELAVLRKFYQFVASHSRAVFLHWNMRDDIYGFPAIEHRYKMLTGQPPAPIHESQRVDLARIMKDIYGTGFAPKPHLKSLAEKNHLETAGLVDGKDEPAYFARGDTKALIASTVRKVTLIAEIAHLVDDQTLKTAKNMWQLNVGRVREGWEFVRDNPLYGLSGIFIMGVVASFKMWLLVLQFKAGMPQ